MLEWLGIRAQDRRRVALAGAFQLVFVGGVVLLKAASNAVFLHRSEPSRLPLLYLGTYGFNVCMSFMIGEYLLGCVDLFLLIPVSVLACTQVARTANRATQIDLERHCQDFPHSPLACLRSQT